MGMEDIHDRLLEDWGKAGCPSPKEIQANAAVSHATASKYLGGHIKTLDSLKRLVEYLGGDVEWYGKEWAKAHVPSVQAYAVESPGPVGDRSYKAVQLDILEVLQEIRDDVRKLAGEPRKADS